MVLPARKLSDLRKRLGRFLTEKACGRDEVHRFLALLEPVGEVAILGGMIRDVALAGIEGFNSDIDLVIEMVEPLAENDQFETVLGEYGLTHKAEKNKFGGYRICLDKWKLDIWRAQDTWAIKQGLVQYNGLESLCRTTFFNWDAVLFSLGNGKLYMPEDYMQTINARFLDFNLLKCPNVISNIIKSLRYREKYDANFSPRLAKYVSDVVQHHSEADIYQRDLESHDHRVITLEDISKIYHSLEKHSKTNSLFTMASEEVQPRLWSDGEHSRLS